MLAMTNLSLQFFPLASGETNSPFPFCGTNEVGKPPSQLPAHSPPGPVDQQKLKKRAVLLIK